MILGSIFNKLFGGLIKSIIISMIKKHIKKEMMMKLNGWKTYVAAALGVIATGLLGLDIITQEVFNTIAWLAGFLGLGFLRNGMKTGAGKKD